VDSALVALLNQSVTIATATMTNVYGEETFGAAATVAARVEPRIENVTTQDGEVEPSRAFVYMNGNVNVTTTSKVTLPDGSTPIILAVEKHTDEAGTVDHTKVVV
jgi:hypothetical protein